MIFLLKLLFVLFLINIISLNQTFNNQNKRKQLLKYFTLNLIQCLILLWLLRSEYFDICLILSFSCFILDILKIGIEDKFNRNEMFFTFILLKVLLVVILWIVYFNIPIDYHYLMTNTNLWIYLTSLIFLSSLSSILIKNILSIWTIEINISESSSLVNAGMYIGILERILIFVFIISNHWEAVGFLIAAKSVFRFGELKNTKDRKLTEYILIGTLLSFGVAVIVSITANFFLMH